MNINKTKFEGLFIINHDVHYDERGLFKEVYKKNYLENYLGYKIDFCQQNYVSSSKYVLRGLHFQEKPFAQSKLITVNVGKILDIAVDLRKNSKTYGKYFSYKLESQSNQSIFIPRGFAHGYLSLSEKTIINYKVDNYYNKNSERGISYLDKTLNIDWSVDDNLLIISEKDRNFIDYKW